MTDDSTELSSCPCYIEGNCPKTCINIGTPTNLGVGNCLYNQRGLKCSPIFKEEEQPLCNKEQGYTLNYIEMARINPDFKTMDCKDNKPCNDKVFVNLTDARLMDTRRNSLIKLDRPPYRSVYFLTNNNVAPQPEMSIYCPEYRNYGRHYKTYNDITAGQITYYVNPEIQDAYFSPNFTIPSKVEGVLYRDPMHSIKPTYVRKEVQAPNQCYNPLSFIRDSAVHREDIMASQMAQRNQRKWSARYTKNRSSRVK